MLNKILTVIVINLPCFKFISGFYYYLFFGIRDGYKMGKTLFVNLVLYVRYKEKIAKIWFLYF